MNDCSYKLSKVDINKFLNHLSSRLHVDITDDGYHERKITYINIFQDLELFDYPLLDDLLDRFYTGEDINTILLNLNYSDSDINNILSIYLPQIKRFYNIDIFLNFN